MTSLRLIQGSKIILGSLEWYEKLWDECLIMPPKFAMVARETDRLLQAKQRYQKVEEITNVPWQMVGALHGLESDFSFGCYLANGDSLQIKTKHVPAGRGPFVNWEEGAVDALKFEGLAGRQDWSIEQMLFMAEKWNGLGYLRYHSAHLSPYLWSCTVWETPGRYCDDGKFDPKGISLQVGFAAFLKQLESLKQI
jgi:lysozyme family protein